MRCFVSDAILILRVCRKQNLEYKAFQTVAQLLPVHAAQFLSYLKQNGGGRGLLINFNEKLLKHGLRRLIV